MRKAKQQTLEAKGWRAGSAEDFLKLTPAQATLVELKLRLSDALKARREKLQLSQVAVAKQLGSSQSRVAKMEAGEASVSLDLHDIPPPYSECLGATWPRTIPHRSPNYC